MRCGAEQVGSILHDVSAVDESSDSSSTDNTLEEDDNEPRGHDERVFHAPEAPEGFKLWQHSKSRVLHLMDENYTRVFACGRVVGNFHVDSGFTPRYETPICSMWLTRAKLDRTVA